MRLEETTVRVDVVDYYIQDIEKIMGILLYLTIQRE